MSNCEIHKKFNWLKCDLKSWHLDPENLCILHSSDPKKDRIAFNKTFTEKLEKEDFNFSGVTFPEHISMRRRKFTKPAKFVYSTFCGFADFLLTSFSYNALFANATFLSGADFSNVVFSKGAYFSSSSFQEKVNFSRTEFSYNSS